MMEKKKSMFSDRKETDPRFGFITERLSPSVTPNDITWMSLIPPSIYCLLIWFSGRSDLSWVFRSIILFLAIIAFFFCVLDGLDGALARKRHSEGKWSENQMKLGNFLDHSVDRISDVIMFFGFPLGGYCRIELFTAAVVAIGLFSYLGVSSEAIYGFREYGGILGRLRRGFILWVATIIATIWSVITIFYPNAVTIRSTIIGFSFFEWLMIVFVVGGLISFLQRFYKIYKFGRNLIQEERE